MRTLRHLTLAAFGLITASAPIAAYTGYYAPHCTDAVVWSLSGNHLQYVCY
jgi:hypothetical protein